MNKTSSIFAAPRTSQSPPNRVSTNYMVARAHRIFRHRPGELTLAVVVLLIALVVYRVQPSVQVAASASAVERGRLVYISEGCIHCHSQYVDKMRPESLPLIDNRRQSPDLSQVGARRSVLWLKMHLYNPREVSGSSIMPSYALLFRGQKGNDLVAYLASLSTPGARRHIAGEQQWHLPAAAPADANLAEGQQLYNHYCATCHNTNGRTRLKWQSEFIESPAVLTSGAVFSGTVSTGDRRPGLTPKPDSTHIDHLAQIIKFGIPDSDMAGHECLPDKDIASLISWLTQNAAQPTQRQ